MKSHKFHKVHIFVTLPIFLFGLTWIGLPPYEDSLNMRKELKPLASLVALYAWYLFFNTAYLVKFTKNNEMKIKTLFKKAIIRPGDIRVIKEGSLFVKIKTEKLTVYLSTLMDDFGSIKSYIKSNNPELITELSWEQKRETSYEKAYKEAEDKPYKLFGKILIYFVILISVAFIVLKNWGQNL